MTRVALFVAGLAGAFLAALLVGRSLDVGERTVAAPEHGGSTPVRAGLAVEQDGYRLVQERAALEAGRSEPYVFRILDADGEVVRRFDVEHERRLHLIVVSRGSERRFLHLHPVQRADGAWTTPLRLPGGGSYRAFADFTTGGERRTLGIDLVGRGSASLPPEPAPDYEVAVERDGDRLDFRVRSHGAPVEVGRYLGARGHLVVLREGDLAYVHAHADEDELSFEVPFPSPGRYDLFLQFEVGGRVETVTESIVA